MTRAARVLDLPSVVGPAAQRIAVAGAGSSLAFKSTIPVTRADVEISDGATFTVPGANLGTAFGAGVDVLIAGRGSSWTRPRDAGTVPASRAAPPKPTPLRRWVGNARRRRPRQIHLQRRRHLDGLIDADDYFRIDSGFLNQPQSPTYAQGNFNYDSVIDADDYFLIDSAFLGQGAPLTASGDLSRLSSIPIPEPTTAFTLLVLATATFARRTTSSLPPLKMPQASHPRDACVVK